MPDRNRTILFIDDTISPGSTTTVRIDYYKEIFHICHFGSESIEASHEYPMQDTVIFHKVATCTIWVHSSIFPSGHRLNTVRFSLKPHIEATFEIFKFKNGDTTDSVWMIGFLPDDPKLSVRTWKYLNLIFDAFTSKENWSDYALNILRDYDPKYLYRYYRQHALKKSKPVDPTDFWPESLLTEEGKARYDKMCLIGGRGNGKTKLVKEMMLNYIKYGDITPPRTEAKEESKMEKMTNFRKDLEYIKRDKKHPNEFSIKLKDSGIIRKIEFQGVTKKDLYSDALVENVLIIASRMIPDYVAKVIFNLKNKMTIIFPWGYGRPEKVIVKANGLDAFDILNGYTIATAKMMCSEDGYEWINKLKKSGKVDV